MNNEENSGKDSVRLKKRRVMFFDIESNGYANSSLLEMYAEMYDFESDGVNEKWTQGPIFHRFYHVRPSEQFNPHAFEVHGIDLDKIKYERAKSDEQYPELWDDDQDNFMEWMSSATEIVAHNIGFDNSFLGIHSKPRFCTMAVSKPIVKATNEKGKIKNPTLKEGGTFFGFKYDDERAHSADYDTYLMFQLFKELHKKGLVPFLEYKVRGNEENKFFLRNPDNTVAIELKDAKPKTLNIRRVSFLITQQSIANYEVSKDTWYAYEKRSGTLFAMADKCQIDKEEQLTLRGAALKKAIIALLVKRIEARFDTIGIDEVNKGFNTFLEEKGIQEVQKDLFDF
jgi:DNA polymerase III epsilon subunit-like protein